MKKNKELWIINHYATPPGYGGLTRHYYLAKYLQKLGFSVKIFASSAIHNSSFNFIEKNDKELFKETVIDGVTYVHVKTRQYSGNGMGRILNIMDFYFNCKKALKKYSKVKKPDYVYSSTPTPFGPLIANKFAKKIHVDSIVETRDLWPYSMYAYGVLNSKRNPIYILFSKIEKKIYTNADKLVFTMGNAIEYLKSQKYYPKLKRDKIYTLGNGLDFDEYKKNKKECHIKDSDLDNKKFKFVYTGSIRHIYNVEMLVELAKSLIDYKDIEFLIYGKGNTEPVEDLIKKYKLKNIKLKGFIDQKYLPYVLSKCQVGLVHGLVSDISKYGMSTNKEALYLSCGLPIINVYPINEDVYYKNKCGISLSEYTIEDYKKKVLFFYNMKKTELKEYQKNANKYCKIFDFRELSKELKKVLEEL